MWRASGELHYATTFMARQVGRLRWDVTIAGTTLEPEASDEIIARVTGTDGPAIVTAAMALHSQVAGDYLYRRLADTGHWVVERPNSGGLSSGGDDEADVEVYTARFDPADPDRIDSPVIAALPVAKELLLLSALSRAQARNRTSQRGLLLYPQTVQWPDGFDFGQMLERLMTAPIEDEHSAAAVVPAQVPIPPDDADVWKVLQFPSAWDSELPSRIERTIRRLALQLDMPAEILTGMADVNHWTAWQIEETTYRAHVEPLARWPARTLRDAIALVADEDPAVIEVDPDPAALLARTPSFQDAIAARNVGAVGDAFIRRLLGADDEDAATPDELARTQPPSPGFAPLTTDQTRTISAALDTEQDVEQLGDRLARLDEQLLQQARGATEQAIGRARERIGARLRTAVRDDPHLTQMIDGVDNRDVAATLGLDVALPQIDADKLAVEGMEALGEWWAGRVDGTWDTVEQLAGVSRPAEANADRDDSTQLLITRVAAHVTSTLGKLTAELPAPPLDAIRRAMLVAGGEGDPGEQAAVGPSAKPGGLATGRRALGAITRATGLVADQWRWVHDDPANPHPAHARLNGRFTNADGQAQTTGFVAYPGDHKGCLCTLVPVFRRQAGVPS